MIDIEEENVLVESKRYSFLFSFDNVNGGLFVNLFNKQNNELIISEHKIENVTAIKRLKELVDKPIGTIFKKGGVRYIIRNHDKCLWSDEGERTYSALSTEGNPYDSRTDFKKLSLFDRTKATLRMAWVNI